MLTQRAKYGLKALCILARVEPGAPPLAIHDVAERGNIPQKFLEAILLDLRRHGFVASRRGKSGGYTLARPAAELPIGDVIRALDGPLAPIPCASLTAYRPCADCADPPSCALRILMRQVRDATSHILDGTSLAALAAAGAEEGGSQVMADLH